MKEALYGDLSVIGMKGCEEFVAKVEAALGRKVATGSFGADMKIELTNDGPVTIWIDSKNRE